MSEWAVLLCPLRIRIVQSFVNYEKNRNCDSPYVTCVMEPSPCQNPLPVQVEEMEVWSGLVWSGLQSQRTDHDSLLIASLQSGGGAGGILQRKDCRKTPNVCFILDLTLLQHPSILSTPGKVIGLVCVSDL